MEPTPTRFDPLHAMQFRATSPPQVTGVRPALQRSWSDRECPLDTADDRWLWHMGGTAGENDGARSLPLWLQLYWWVRPVLGDHRLVGKPRRRRGSRVPLWVMSHLSTVPVGTRRSRNQSINCAIG